MAGNKERCRELFYVLSGMVVCDGLHQFSSSVIIYLMLTTVYIYIHSVIVN